MQEIDLKLLFALYDFLLKCGKENDVYQFCGTIVKELYHFLPYDQARILFLDGSGKIRSSMLYGVNQRTWNAFMNYYSESMMVSNYSLKRPLHISENERVQVCDWTDPDRRRSMTEFADGYVKPLKLKYCLGIGFSDNDNCLRCIMTLDRIRDQKYSKDEILLVKQLHPLLENLFEKFFVSPPDQFSHQEFLFAESLLTQREREIAGWLLEGLSPASMSERLSISINTVYKHIANMYKKLGVSNRQEFFAKLIP